MQYILNFYTYILSGTRYWTEEVLPKIFNDRRVIDHESMAMSQKETKDV